MEDIRGEFMNILCIGHAAYDTTVPVLEFPEENTKNRVPERLENGGGPANNAAYLLGKWGMNTYFAGIVGDDIAGKKIKQELENVNVSTKYLEFNKKHTTTSSFIIANQANGSRTIMTYRPSKMKMSDIDISENIDVILVDGQEYEFSKKILAKYPNAISIIDAGRPIEEVIDLCYKVNYVVCSKEFAETVSETIIDTNDFNTLKMVIERLEEKFKTNIVITLESKGCLYRDSGVIKIMPSLEVKPVDSTGAGDIFHGAFTYAIANQFSYEDSLKIACVAGAISVTRLGSRRSMPEKEEMKMYIHEFR